MVDNMSYKNIIKKRELILEKVHKKEKLTKQERYWLITNPLFNTLYDSPIYLQDIIELKPNCLYSISVNVKLINCSYEIHPIIGVASLNGKIITHGLLRNIDEEIVDYNETKVLILLLDENNSSSEIEFIAEDGFVSIGYHCSFYDEKMQIIKKMSSDCNCSFGMQKRIISKTCIEYSCKSIFADSFDALVFTLEWKETNKTE